jgi:hypothetical protein
VVRLPEPADHHEAQDECHELVGVLGQQRADAFVVEFGGDVDQRQHEQRRRDGHDRVAEVDDPVDPALALVRVDRRFRHLPIFAARCPRMGRFGQLMPVAALR